MNPKTERIIEPSEAIFALQQESILELSALLPHEHIESIGAMSVPMAGKEEIDLLVISDHVEESSEILEQNGYRRGPVVDGISFLKKKVDGIEVAVQIMEPDSEMIKIHRDIIALLQVDADLRTRYEDFKRSLSGMTREEYKKQKSAWIEEHIKPRLG